MDAYSESEEAKAENVISVVKRGNTLCADGLITCKKPSTAVKRFFKAVKNWKTFDGWEAEILEEIEVGLYRLSLDLEAGRWWEIEEPTDGVFYFAISEIDADTEEEKEPEEEEPEEEKTTAEDAEERKENKKMTMYEVTYTVDEEKGIYSAFMLEAEDIETARAYAESLKENVIGVCIAPTRPKPGQSVLTVPADWTPEEEDAPAEESAAASEEDEIKERVNYFIDFINTCDFDPYNQDEYTEKDIRFYVNEYGRYDGARILITADLDKDIYYYIDTEKGAIYAEKDNRILYLDYYSEDAFYTLKNYYREMYKSIIKVNKENIINE